MKHYYSSRPVYGKKQYISLYIRGVTLEFITYTSLFSGREVDEGTRLIIEYMEIPSEGNVLDVGCGYGVIGIFLAKYNPRLRVYMVDVNPLAVKVSKYNARLNSVEDRVYIVQGNLYEPFEKAFFNAIYSNPPLATGKNVVEKLLLDAKEYLVENGFLQVVLAKGGEYYTSLLEKEYSRVEKIKKKGYTIVTAYK